METSSKLPRFEVIFYYVIWIGSVTYSIYNVYTFKRYFSYYPDLHNDFSPGWSWIGGKRDTADYEWQTWIPLFFNLIPWLITHTLGSIFIKYKTRLLPITSTSEILCIWYIMISVHFLYYYFGILGILFIFVQPCISLLLLAINNKTITWITNLIILIAINFAKFSESVYQYFIQLDNEEYYMLMTVACWTLLRSISFVMDNYPNRNISSKSFFMQLLRITAYNLYLPTLFFGPIILYKDFIDGTMEDYISWNLKRLLSSLFNIGRYIFWLFFTEFALHYIYVNALQYHPEILKKMDSWALYGFGYCMGQYFLNKYVVVYGLSSEFAKMDDIEAPPTPKCIGRIHLYSDMWKHFDVGFYKFLLKYIYIPVTNTKFSYRKLLGIFLSFGFVFMWHGMQKFIFVWSALNFIGIIIEHFANQIASSAHYKSLLLKYSSPNITKRFLCAISSPLLVMSAVSNFYFFGGFEIGNFFILKVLKDILQSPEEIVVLLFCIYCCCQVSTDLKSIEKEKKVKIKK